jgi:hypothetical protein
MTDFSLVLIDVVGQIRWVGQNRTVLMYAILAGLERLAETLIDKGADVTAQDAKVCLPVSSASPPCHSLLISSACSCCTGKECACVCKGEELGEDPAEDPKRSRLISVMVKGVEGEVRPEFCTTLSCAVLKAEPELTKTCFFQRVPPEKQLEILVVTGKEGGF